MPYPTIPLHRVCLAAVAAALFVAGCTEAPTGPMADLSRVRTAPVAATHTGSEHGALDQQSTGTDGLSHVTRVTPHAQTYTAGLTGSQDLVDLLVRKELDPGIGPTGDLTVQIRSVVDGKPSDVVLGSEVVSDVQPVDWTSIRFDPAVPVVAGTQYAIVLMAPDAPGCAGGSSHCADYLWLGAFTGGYSGGQRWSGFIPAWTATSADLSFKTYVSPPNHAPLLAEVIAGPRAGEGKDYFVQINIEDDDALDTHVVTFNWGDGTSDVVALPAGPTNSAGLFHRFADNPPGPLPEGQLIMEFTVADQHGASDSQTWPVIVANIDPTATFNAPASVVEGEQLSISLTDATDRGPVDLAAGFQYAFDCGEGAGYGAYGAASSAACATTVVGERTVKGSIRDKDGGTTEYTAQVTVEQANRNPSIAPSNTQVVASEGTTAANGGSYSDLDGDVVTLAASVGTVTGNGATWSWTNPAPDGPGSYSVDITATDGRGGSAQTTFSVIVTNVAPTISGVSNSGPVAFGQAATVTVGANDPAGVNDPLSYSFDCNNDGAYEIGPQASASAQCTFGGSGARTVNVRVTDGDGGTATGSTVVTALAPTIGGLIDAANAAVANGTLVGSGPGNSAAGRLGAWLNTLKAAQNAGNASGVCNQLAEAYRRIDGSESTPDFVAGPAAASLRAMLAALRASLGCPAA